MSPGAWQGVGAGATPRGEEVGKSSLRELDPRRQNQASVLAAHQLTPMERLVLLAYVDAQGVHGSCWPADSQVAAFLGTTVLTVRRARRALAKQAFIEVQHVAPLHRLPNGKPSPHGAIVVTVLGMVPGSSDVGTRRSAAKRQCVTCTHRPSPAPLRLAA
jgi:hypothetical protein